MSLHHLHACVQQGGKNRLLSVNFELCVLDLQGGGDGVDKLVLNISVHVIKYKVGTHLNIHIT